MNFGWLSRFLRGRDSFGHPVQVLFKGRETYNSVLGGFCTLLLQLLTAVMIYKAIEEVLLMNDPTITSFTKPLTTAARKDLIPVKLDDNNYVIAAQASLPSGSMPPGFARFVATVVNVETNDETTAEFVNCT